VNWTSGTGLVSVVDLGTNSCTSQPANCTPTVLTSPLVQFDYSGDGEEISFVDQSSGSTTWHWDFGDGNSATSQNPNHTYSGDSETYQVTLIITNANGCVGSGTKTVELFHDINVPNIITPNNDGINDAFFIKTAGIKSYQLVIVNRWGNVVFKSTDPQIIWDGTIDGQQASEGVYFYTLNVSSSTKDYKFQGNVTLIRN
jgi:gliding motility-associated-like protein